MSDESGIETEAERPRIEIVAAYGKLLEAIGVIGKESKNAHFGYQFRGIDAIQNHLQPALIKAGLLMWVQFSEPQISVNGKSTRVIVRVNVGLKASDGSSVEFVAYGEGLDTGDKATMKAQSVAFREAISKGLAIPFQSIESEADPETDKEAAKPAKAKASNENKSDKPAMSAAVAKEFMRQIGEAPTQDALDEIVAELNKARKSFEVSKAGRLKMQATIAEARSRFNQQEQETA